MKRITALIMALITLLALPHGAVFARGAELRGQAGADVSGFSSPLIGGGAATGAVFTGYSLSIVTYWATWNAGAMAQLAHLQALHTQRPDIGVFGLLYTDSTSTAEAALAYMQEQGYTFPVFLEDAVWTGVVTQAPFMPQSFFVSPGGVILEAYPGAFASPAAMLQEAEQWIGAPGTYTVRFFDRFRGSCTLLASYTGLASGASVAAPEAPEHAGYDFIGWSSTGYNNVTGNLDIFTEYHSNLPDGDVDGSGVTDPQDALALLRMVMGLLPMGSAVLQHGDMDMDGRITVSDVLALMRYILYGTI